MTQVNEVMSKSESDQLREKVEGATRRAHQAEARVKYLEAKLKLAEAQRNDFLYQVTRLKGTEAVERYLELEEAIVEEVLASHHQLNGAEVVTRGRLSIDLTDRTVMVTPKELVEGPTLEVVVGTEGETGLTRIKVNGSGEGSKKGKK